MSFVDNNIVNIIANKGIQSALLLNIDANLG